jgi:hypothetical protein
MITTGDLIGMGAVLLAAGIAIGFGIGLLT